MDDLPFAGLFDIVVAYEKADVFWCDRVPCRRIHRVPDCKENTPCRAETYVLFVVVGDANLKTAGITRDFFKNLYKVPDYRLPVIIDGYSSFCTFCLCNCIELYCKSNTASAGPVRCKPVHIEYR